MASSIYIIRHGETAWSKSGQHTGRTDLPLSEDGEREARKLSRRLVGLTFDRVLTSPLLRARQTCDLAGLGSRATVDPDLAEWDYGDYEGKTTPEVHAERPLWDLFADGCPGGESTGQVSARADRFLSRASEIKGTLAVFSHGHFGRVLAARWILLPVAAGKRLDLATASLSILGFEHGPDTPVLKLWNEDVARS
jgi:probable phosphoglycerate mutase